MGDLKLPSNGATPKVSSLIQQGAQSASRAQPTVTPAPHPSGATLQSATRAADQVVSQALQKGQASHTLTFVESSPPTAEELRWCQELDARIKTGYTPTAEETRKYNAIADQLEASLPVPPTQPLDKPVSDREAAWANGLEDKVVHGHRASEAEKATYRNIAYRMLKADQPPVLTGNVTRQEMDWAVSLQKRVQEMGYQPTPDELKQFSDIYLRSQQPAPPAPSAEEIAWAQQLAERIQQGYQPTEAEVAKYNQIYQASQPSGSEKVSADESNWALQLNRRTAQGYRPTQAEMDRYGDITRRLALQDPNSIRPEDRIVSQHELDWAGELQQRLRSGIAASPEELERYQRIYDRHAGK